jgi:hypothetical protein
MRRLILLIIGLFYAMIGLSMLSAVYNFFDIHKPIPEGQPQLWLVYFLVPPIVISIIDKLRVIFFPKEHENVFRDQLLSINTLVAETVAWAIPNILTGIIWAVGILVVYALFWYLVGVHFLADAAEYLGLIVQTIK